MALRIAAADLADDPEQPISGQVATLRVGDRLAALEIEGDPDAAVRAAFGASYQRLAAPERQLFRLLGLVPGPHFTASAAAALVGSSAGDTGQSLDRLAAAHLVDRYIPGRYRLHDLLRLYAAERAQEIDPGERAAATRRLLELYVLGADAAGRLLYPEMLRLPSPGDAGPQGRAPFTGRAQALEWLDLEAPNLLAAVRHAADHGPRPLAFQLADTLRGYFWLRVPAASWQDVASAARSAAVAEGDLHAQVAAALSLGDLHWNRNRYPEAIGHYTEAVRHSQEAGWRDGEAVALDRLGLAHWRSGQLQPAATYLTRSLAVARRIGSRAGQMSVLGNLGGVSAELGMLKQAADHFTAALALKPESSATGAGLLDGLGEVSYNPRQLDQALDHLTEALARFREIGYRGGQSDALRNLAGVHTDAGRYDQALELAGEALELARQIGVHPLEAGALKTRASATPSSASAAIAPPCSGTGAGAAAGARGPCPRPGGRRHGRPRQRQPAPRPAGPGDGAGRAGAGAGPRGRLPDPGRARRLGPGRDPAGLWPTPTRRPSTPARRSPSTARPGTGSAKLAPSASSATPSAAPRDPTPHCRIGMRRSPSSPTPAQPPKPTPSATSWRPPATGSAQTGRLSWLVSGRRPCPGRSPCQSQFMADDPDQ